MDNNNNFLLLIIAAIVIYYFLKDSFDCSNNVEGFGKGRRGRRGRRGRTSYKTKIEEDNCKAKQPIDEEGPYESCADMNTRVKEHRCKNTEVIDGEGPYESCADRKQTEKEWCQSNKIRPRRCQSTIRNELNCKGEEVIDEEGPYESCADMTTRVREHRCKNTEVIDDEQEGPYESCADKMQTEKEWCESNEIGPKKCQTTIRNELKCKGEGVIDGGPPYESCADMTTRVREHRCKNTEVIDDEQEGPYESCADKMQTEKEWCQSNEIDPKKCQTTIRNELKCRKEGVIDGGPPYESCKDRNVRKIVANQKCRQEDPIDATVMNSNHPVYGYKSCEDRNARIRNFRDCIVEKAPSCLIRSGREN